MRKILRATGDATRELTVGYITRINTGIQITFR